MTVPGDPFGPVDQDPDVIREAACRLVAESRVCDPPSPPSPPGGPDLAWLATIVQALFWLFFVAVVAAVVMAVLGVVVRALSARGPATRIRRRRRRHPTDIEVEALTPMQIDTTRDPTDWRREADEHRRAGRAREALRCRYRALVGDLARNGVIDEIPGRTTGEERHQYTGSVPGGGSTFDQAATLFDDAWYGSSPVDDTDVDVMERLERQVLADAASRVR